MIELEQDSAYPRELAERLLHEGVTSAALRSLVTDEMATRRSLAAAQETAGRRVRTYLDGGSGADNLFAPSLGRSYCVVVTRDLGVHLTQMVDVPPLGTPFAIPVRERDDYARVVHDAPWPSGVTTRQVQVVPVGRCEMIAEMGDEVVHALIERAGR